VSLAHARLLTLKSSIIKSNSNSNTRVKDFSIITIVLRAWINKADSSNLHLISISKKMSPKPITLIKKRVTRKSRSCCWIISARGSCKASLLRATMEAVAGEAMLRTTSAICWVGMSLITFRSKSWKIMRQRLLNRSLINSQSICKIVSYMDGSKKQWRESLLLEGI
jgi:hypothetical protein